MHRDAQQADPVDLDAFYRATWPTAYAYARRLLGDHHAAEDVAATAMSNTLARWQRLGTPEQPAAYLLRAVHNEAVSLFRRNARSRDALAASRPEPASDDPAAEAVERLTVDELLAELPRSQQAVVVLRYLEDRSEADAAAALGLPRGTVKSHLHRGLRRMRDAVEVAV